MYRSSTSSFRSLSLSMNVEHPRPPYQHHAGFYRKIMPDDLKPWEWSPLTDHSLPMSPMRPIFQIPKSYPPGLSGPVPSPSMLLVKIPANVREKRRGLWVAIRRFLRFGECLIAILVLSLNYLVHSFRFPEFGRRCGHTAFHSCAAGLCSHGHSASIKSPTL